MAGIDLILTTLCINITCDTIRLEKSPVQANYWLKNCIANQTCEHFSLPKPTDVVYNAVESNLTTSLELKEFALDEIRQKLNGAKLKIVTMEDYPLSYKDRKTGKYEGVAFQILDFLKGKFNFTYDVITPPGNKFGSTDDMTGSLIETVNKTL